MSSKPKHGPAGKRGKNKMEIEEKSKLAENAGFRFASYYEAENATHAICDCGIIVKVNEAHHVCARTRLVRIKEK